MILLSKVHYFLHFAYPQHLFKKKKKDWSILIQLKKKKFANATIFQLNSNKNYVWETQAIKCIQYRGKFLTNQQKNQGTDMT